MLSSLSLAVCHVCMLTEDHHQGAIGTPLSSPPTLLIQSRSLLSLLSPPPPRASGPSHRLPPLAEHIVDELGHGLGAAVAPPVCPVPQLLHHLADEQREEVGNVLVALGRRHFLEVAAALLGEAPALVLAHLPRVTEVLLVAQQAHGDLGVPAKCGGQKHIRIEQAPARNAYCGEFGVNKVSSNNRSQQFCSRYSVYQQ